MNTVNYESTILDFAKEAYSRLGKKAFFEFYGRKISYDSFFALVDDCAENLARLGVEKGTVVTLTLPNCPQFVIAVYALAKIGAIASLISPLASKTSVEAAMQKTGSKIIIVSTLCPHEFTSAQVIRVHFNFFMPFVKKAVMAIKKHYSSGFAFENLLVKTHEPFVLKGNVEPHAPAFYLHSGGTTGEPKTVVLSQSAVNYCALTISGNMADNDVKPEDKMTCAYVLPLFYGYGLGVIHTQICNAYNNVIRAKFKPEELAKDFAKYKINLMFGVPFMYSKMLQTGIWNKDSVKDLKLCYIGGERLTDELNDEFKKAFPDSLMVEGYGMTEAVTAFIAGSLKGTKKNSCGKLNDFIKIEVFEGNEPLPRGSEGEICIQTDALMNGYLGDEENTAKTLFEYNGEKWLRTGDYGRVDEEGFVFLIQRIKNIIKRKGVNVFPVQIESVVAKLPFVTGVKVFGKKDAEAVERIVCAVTLTDAPENAEQLIKDKVKEEISVVSTPEYVLIVDSFPLTTVGKVDVKKLQEGLEGKI